MVHCDLFPCYCLRLALDSTLESVGDDADRMLWNAYQNARQEGKTDNQFSLDTFGKPNAGYTYNKLAKLKAKAKKEGWE